MPQNPCLQCGACCAYYRASFYWAECDDATENGVPITMTEKFNDFRMIMKGTDGSSPWCVALKGIIGGRVSCEIYDRRSSVCRAFEPSWYANKQNERCDKARAAWGLAPLQPGSWPDRGSDVPPSKAA